MLLICYFYKARSGDGVSIKAFPFLLYEIKDRIISLTINCIVFPKRSEIANAKCHSHFFTEPGCQV